ncbi:hypothetical protein BHE74_00032134 [Ensete ventricosum]|nr:hypothetical protein BHE74_00032134 [Ensete ventricosum]
MDGSLQAVRPLRNLISQFTGYIGVYRSSSTFHHHLLWDFGAVAEESTRPSPCRVRKLVHVSRWRGRPVGFGLASRESTPRVGFLGNHSSRWLLRRTCTKASSGWGCSTCPLRRLSQCLDLLIGRHWCIFFCLREEPLLVPPKGGFILTGREVARMLGLISVVISGVVESYGESVGAKAWREGMARHAALMAHDDNSAVVASDRFHLGCRCGYGAGAGPHLTQMLTWPLS